MHDQVLKGGRETPNDSAVPRQDSVTSTRSLEKSLVKPAKPAECNVQLFTKDKMRILDLFITHHDMEARLKAFLLEQEELYQKHM